MKTALRKWTMGVMVALTAVIFIRPQAVAAGSSGEDGVNSWAVWDWRSNWSGGDEGVGYCYEPEFNGETITGSNRVVLMNSQKCIGGKTGQHKRACAADEVMRKRWDWSSYVGWEVYECVDGDWWEGEMERLRQTRNISYCRDGNYYRYCKTGYKPVAELTPTPTAVPTVRPTAVPTKKPTPTPCPPTPTVTPSCESWWNCKGYHRERKEYGQHESGTSVSIYNSVSSSSSSDGSSCGWVTEYYQSNGGNPVSRSVWSCQ